MPSKDTLEYVERQRTITSAAEAVRDLAIKAKEMLDQLQTSKWWPLLTLPDRPK